MLDLKKAVDDIMRGNRRTTGEYQYTLPSPQSYPYQWFWDSCFHAIILSHLNPGDAKRELLSLVAKQFENGMIPHMIYWQRSEAAEHNHLNIAWGRDGTSSITQPPMLAYATWKVFEKDPDTSFLLRMYPTLFHFYQYLLRERDPHARHLIGIINPDESGEDNSPRFDEILDLPPVHDLSENFKRRLSLVEENRKCNFDAPFCMKNFFWVKDVPFNAIMVENLHTLARIAEKIERGYDAAYFDKEAELIATSMRALMFEDGIFWPTRGEHYEKVRVKTWAMFAPLFAKISTKDEANALVEMYLKNEKEFWTPHMIPTVPISESSFNPEGFWRGPVWMSVNWFLFQGLRNYGMDEMAEEVRMRSLRLLETSGFREYFHPFSGKGYGAENFTWGGLVLDMMES